MEFVEYAIARWDEDGYLNTPVRGGGLGNIAYHYYNDREEYWRNPTWKVIQINATVMKKPIRDSELKIALEDFYDR